MTDEPGFAVVIRQTGRSSDRRACLQAKHWCAGYEGEMSIATSQDVASNSGHDRPHINSALELKSMDLYRNLFPRSSGHIREAACSIPE